MSSASSGAELAAAVRVRTAAVVAALRELDHAALLSPSELPGWTRLTIACHLRYGADASARLTRAALAGEPAAFYPEGRSAQRPGTLRPEMGESAVDVVASLSEGCRQLDELWSGLGDDDWSRAITEPAGAADLGRLTVAGVVLLRLTEVEVHGCDLGLGLDDWSGDFVGAALPFRLERLNARPAARATTDRPLDGSWLLVATDGPTYLVAVEGERVSSRPADPTADAAPATARIEATSRDLLALLLGRPLASPPTISGDVEFAHAFTRTFPGP